MSETTPTTPTTSAITTTSSGELEGERSTAAATRARMRRPRSSRPLTPEERAVRQAIFLTSYAGTGNVSAAAGKAGVETSTVYRWLKHREFAERFSAADLQAQDVLRGEAFRRAVMGWDEVVVSAGRVVIDPTTGEPLKQRRHSDAVLLAMLKARVPEYRDRSEVDLRASVQHEVTVYELPQKRALPSALFAPGVVVEATDSDISADVDADKRAADERADDAGFTLPPKR